MGIRLVDAVDIPVLHEVRQVAKSLNIPCYVIGGYVRDYLLKHEKRNEIDIVVVGDAVKLAKTVAEKMGSTQFAIYKRFGTAMVQVGEWKLEFAMARKESYSPDSRHPQVMPSTLEEDWKRRDFTINALTIALFNGEFGTFYDPFDGVNDLQAKIIRTPLNPDITFSDDPLRMLRAIRFATVLQFKIEENTFKAIKRNRNRIQIISQERITEEVNKIILAEKPSIGFKLLFKTGLLEIIFPELYRLHGVEEVNGVRHKDNFFHTLKVLDNVANAGGDLWLRWAALLHDIAKPLTKAFDPKEGWTFHGHDAVGAEMVPKLFRKWKLPLDERMRRVQTLVKLHLRPIALAKEETTDSAIRRLIVEAGDYLKDLMTLCRCDLTTKDPEKKKRYLENFDKVERRIYEVQEKDRLRQFQPPIRGDEIMNYFQIPPCRAVGEIKQAIKDAILDGIIPNDRKAAWEYMCKIGPEILKKYNIPTSQSSISNNS